MAGFGHRTQQTDPMIHFYEDFLAAYDPKQRKNRGVWYTPQAVVSCIVKTVDEILQAEFNLPMGLADTSKITVERSIDQSKDKRFSDGKRKRPSKSTRYSLDPATGTARSSRKPSAESMTSSTDRPECGKAMSGNICCRV